MLWLFTTTALLLSEQSQGGSTSPSRLKLAKACVLMTVALNPNAVVGSFELSLPRAEADLPASIGGAKHDSKGPGTCSAHNNRRFLRLHRRSNARHGQHPRDERHQLDGVQGDRSLEDQHSHSSDRHA